MSRKRLLPFVCLFACGSLPDTKQAPRVLETYAELGVAPGDIAVARDQELLISLHPYYQPRRRFAVRENGAWHFADSPHLTAPTAVAWGRDGSRWFVDGSRLVALGGDRVTEWHLPHVEDSFPTDLVLDEARRHVYIADRAGGPNASLIVVPFDGDARRVLVGHKSVVPEDIDLFVDGLPLESGNGARPRLGVSTLAVDGAGGWLYYGPTHGRSLYRVRLDDLTRADLEHGELAKRVERYGPKPISGGLVIDGRGRPIVADLAGHSVGVVTRSRFVPAVTDDRLSWVDSMSLGPDGTLFLAANQLHRSAALGGGHNTARQPFLILRMPVSAVDR